MPLFNFRRWLRHLRSGPKVRTIRRRPPHRLAFELLEDRTLPAGVIHHSDTPPPLPGGFPSNSSSGDGVSGQYRIDRDGSSLTDDEIRQIRGIIEEIDDDPDQPYTWQEQDSREKLGGDAELGPAYVLFIYTARNPEEDCVDTEGNATGVSVFIGQHQAFNGNVATFQITSSKTMAPGDFAALIFWGDGTKSQGTISSTGSNGFAVTGQHTYDLDGTYLPLVDIYRTAPDCDVRWTIASRPTPGTTPAARPSRSRPSIGGAPAPASPWRAS